jgi:hypothetical protein
MFLNEPHVRVSSRLAYPQCGHEGRVVHEILGVLSESLYKDPFDLYICIILTSIYVNTL